MSNVSLVTLEALNQMRQEAKSFSFNWFRKLYPNGQIAIRKLSSTQDTIVVEATLTATPGSQPISSCPIQCSRKYDGDNFIENAPWRAIEDVLVKAGFRIVMVEAVEDTETSPVEPVPTVAPAPTVEPVPTVAPTPTVEPVPTVAPAPVVEPAPTVAPTPTVEPAPTVAPPPTPPPPPTLPPPPTVEPVPTVAPTPTVESVSNVLAFPGSSGGGPQWTPYMPVEQIMGLMTLDEAKEYPIREGFCVGSKLADVVGNIGVLGWYAHSYKGADNALAAGANLLFDEAKKQKLA